MLSGVRSMCLLARRDMQFDQSRYTEAGLFSVFSESFDAGGGSRLAEIKILLLHQKQKVAAEACPASGELAVLYGLVKSSTPAVPAPTQLPLVLSSEMSKGWTRQQTHSTKSCTAAV
jgi:hypothetical protein